MYVETRHFLQKAFLILTLLLFTRVKKCFVSSSRTRHMNLFKRSFVSTSINFLSITLKTSSPTCILTLYNFRLYYATRDGENTARNIYFLDINEKLSAINTFSDFLKEDLNKIIHKKIFNDSKFFIP